MALVRLRCQLGGECRYETVPLEYEQANQQVESHMRWAHSPHSGQPPVQGIQNHRFSEFLGVMQCEGETASQFVSRLRAAAACCDFTVRCPSCRGLVSYSESLVTQKLVLSLSLSQRDQPETVSDSREHIRGENGESGSAYEAQEEENEKEEDREAAKLENQEYGVKEEEEDLTILNIESLAPSSPLPVRKRRKKMGNNVNICPKCPKYFYSRGNVLDHCAHTHYKARLRRLIKNKEDNECPYCQKTFSTENNTVRHIGVTHGKVRAQG